MMTPPPVSGDAYPVSIGSEMRSNYLGGGIVFMAAYQDNLLLQQSTRPISDESYSFVPTINFDRRTPRQGESLNYSSGFTLYQNTTELNGINQSATAGYRFHMSPYAVVELRDEFRQNYNLYNQGNSFITGGVSGTPGSSNTVLIAPFENQFGNLSNVAIDYQYGRNAMIGGSGSYSFLHYSDHSQSVGLNDGNTTTGSAFFSRRIARSEYVGAVYQFSKFITHPVNTDTLTHTVFGFYTHYFTRSFSMSLLAGPEHYTALSPATPKEASWAPAVQASIGWQDLRWSASASYSRIVSGAGGLIGTYDASLASLAAQLAVSRTWIIGANGGYSLFDNVNPTDAALSSGGHTVSGIAFLRRRVSGRLNAEVGYGHFHQSYTKVPGQSLFPDSNRGYVSIAYGFNRPLGR
jgi:hypothetical protein